MTDTIDKEIEKHINELEKRIMINGMHPVIHDIDPNAAWIIDRAEWEIFKKKILADRQKMVKQRCDDAVEQGKIRDELFKIIEKQKSRIEKLEKNKENWCRECEYTEKLNGKIKALEECDVCNGKAVNHLCRKCYLKEAFKPKDVKKPAEGKG